MPTYGYRCLDCGNEFEEFQKITDLPVASRTKCRGQKVMRQIGGGAALFQFQGSDFYCTDYKTGGKTPVDNPTNMKGGCCPCAKNQKKKAD